MNWQNLLIIGSGGFIGAILRVESIYYINDKINSSIPMGTIFVNIFGSFMAGLLIAYLETNNNIYLRSFLMLGVLGALTTYSTFAIESIMLFSQIKYFFIYTLLNVIGSMAFAFIGYKIMLFFMIKN